ncbi:hypothetical protein FRC01_011468 [Tulasnella sp. 417]|nr:hypothetical protein FRC01_011468 [Tulasnella sp. 417]
MPDQSTSGQQQNPLEEDAQPDAVVRISARKVLESLSMLRISKTRIKPLEDETCGRGGNADVIAAELAPVQGSEPSLPDEIQHVAVKKLRLDVEMGNAGGPALLAHEVYLLNDLSHNNIIKVIGFVEDVKDGTAWIILPSERNGNLREFIASADWEFPERVALLNILINSKNEAVITDFGSARSVKAQSGDVKSSPTQAPSREAVPSPIINSPKVEIGASGDTITLTAAQWTVRWAAPELLTGSNPDLSSDIWAFGWICWEACFNEQFPLRGAQ